MLLAGIAGWSASGGVDIPEGNLFALHQLLAAANFRADATKILVWFGDAPEHDPVCAAISGQSAAVTEASVTAELVAAGVLVIAVSTTTGAPAGLDGDPTAGAVDYVAACGAPDGTAGQATRVAAATGGPGVHRTEHRHRKEALPPVTGTAAAGADRGGRYLPRVRWSRSVDTSCSSLVSSTAPDRSTRAPAPPVRVFGATDKALC